MSLLIEEGLFKFLRANTAITALLQSDVTSSIWQGFTPETTLQPSIMFKKITGKSDTTLDGPSGWVERRYQFNMQATDAPNTPGSGYVEANILADMVRQQMDGLRGTLPNGVRLFNMILDLELDDYDADTQVYSSIQDYIVQFQHTTPSA
jgi:hypothetical protein